MSLGLAIPGTEQSHAEFQRVGRTIVPARDTAEGYKNLSVERRCVKARQWGRRDACGMAVRLSSAVVPEPDRRLHRQVGLTLAGTRGQLGLGAMPD